MQQQLAAILALLATAMVFSMAPDRPAKKKEEPKKEKKAPDLSGETNWGKLEQKGRDFTITGGDVWVCSGQIRKDGKVEVVWTLLSSGADCPAVYELGSGRVILIGHYGYSASGAYIDEAGVLQGPKIDETIWRR